MNMNKDIDQTYDLAEKNKSNFGYYGLIIYTMLFYSQIAGRFQFLQPFRLELVVGSILVVYSLYQIITGKIDIGENKLNYFAILFIIIAFITIPFAYVRSRALETFISFVKFFAIYLMIITSIDSEKKLKGFIYVYLSMITLLFIEPFFLSLFGKGFIWNNHMWRLAGITGYFEHPNQLGGITSANLPLFFYLMKYEKSKYLKFILFSLILISLNVIMLTQSRTAFMGVLTFSFFLWLFSNNKIVSFAIIIISTIVIWQFTPQETKDRFISLGDAGSVVSGEMGHEEAGSMYSRWVLIQRGFIAFKENPIIGLGLNCYISFNGHRYGYYFPPHNTFIQALTEMGLLGFTAFVLVIIYTIKNLIISRRYLAKIEDDTNYISSLIMGLLIYILVRSMVSLFGQDLYANYWWLAGGLSVVVLRITIQKHQIQFKTNIT